MANLPYLLVGTTNYTIPQIWRGTQAEYDAISSPDPNTTYYITDGTSGALALGDLSNVAISSPSGGQVLKYDSTNNIWVNGTGGSGGTWQGTQAEYDALSTHDPDVSYYITDSVSPSLQVSNLSDVSLTNITNGQTLVYQNGTWVNDEAGGKVWQGTQAQYDAITTPDPDMVYYITDSAQSNFVLADLSNVSFSQLTGGQVLKYDSTNNVWTNGNAGSGGTWEGTKAQYDALPSHDPDVTYYITDGVANIYHISDLADVSITSATAGQSLIYDTATSRWVNGRAGTGLYTVTGTQTTQTSAWTGALHGVSALYDGLSINYYIPQNSALDSSVTLNLTLDDNTTTGAIGVYIYPTKQATTEYNSGRSVLLTYFSAGSIDILGIPTSVDMWISTAYVDKNVEQQPISASNVNMPIALSIGYGRRATGAIYSDYPNFTYNPSTTTLTVPNISGSVAYDNTSSGLTATTVQGAVDFLGTVESNSYTVATYGGTIKCSKYGRLVIVEGYSIGTTTALPNASAYTLATIANKYIPSVQKHIYGTCNITGYKYDNAVAYRINTDGTVVTYSYNGQTFSNGAFIVSYLV